MASESLFDRIGGDYSLNAVIDPFYSKVLSDDLLMPFFDGVCMDAQMYKMKIFLKTAFGGVSSETLKHIGRAHKGMVERGLSDSHIDRIIIHMRAALSEAGVESALVIEVVNVIDGYRDEVLGR